MMLTMTIRKLTCCMTGKQVRGRAGAWKERKRNLLNGNGNAKVGDVAVGASQADRDCGAATIAGPYFIFRSEMALMFSHLLCWL